MPSKKNIINLQLSLRPYNFFSKESKFKSTFITFVQVHKLSSSSKGPFSVVTKTNILSTGYFFAYTLTTEEDLLFFAIISFKKKHSHGHFFILSLNLVITFSTLFFINVNILFRCYKKVLYVSIYRIKMKMWVAHLSWVSFSLLSISLQIGGAVIDLIYKNNLK